ncbi:MAG: hypothetical protein A2Y17_13430 [Clostridiales bacterium GWF2_38_85]|nr:MAG: hypothetical protein A2Y17_13430 [Clostridiales bacterium GWF2_38_85]
MNDISREVYLVQNPAIGAAVIWRFVCGYYECDNRNISVPFPLLFLVLPIIFREDLREVIKSTQKAKGLQKVAEKLFITKKADLFCGIQSTAEQYKETTLSSIHIASNANLIAIDTKTALVSPLQTKASKMPKTSDELLMQSEKLGMWCSTMTLYEISTLLKVRF